MSPPPVTALPALAGSRLRGLLLGVALAGLAPSLPLVAAPLGAAGSLRGGGELQIDESSPDESPLSAGRPVGQSALPERLRASVEGSLARYDALKSESAGFRRRGWFPSIFLRQAERDVVIEPGGGGAAALTVHLSYARRDLEQRLVIAPAARFELPGADKRFFCELLGELAAAAPELSHVRLRFWFGVLRADGRMSWESRGGIGVPAAAVRVLPPGARTVEKVWPLLDENSLPPGAWDER